MNNEKINNAEQFIRERFPFWLMEFLDEANEAVEEGIQPPEVDHLDIRYLIEVMDKHEDLEGILTKMFQAYRPF